MLLTAVAALVVGGLGWWLTSGGDGEPAPPPPAPSADRSPGPPEDPQPTLVLATFDETDRTAGAMLVTLLAWDRSSGAGTILLIPSTTVADVPGHGLLQVGRAFGFGGPALLDATLDNLLGVDLDATLGISRQSWSALFTRAGGLTVDVPERLIEREEDGTGTTRFAEGEQFLDGPRLAELLTFREDRERELDALPRVQLVLTTLLRAIEDDPSVAEAVFGDGAPMLELSQAGLEADDVRAILEHLADAQAAGELVVRTLPVTSIGNAEDDSYQLDTERAEALVDERLADSVPVTGSGTVGRRIEIRNGNGVPGNGQQVAQLLIPAGFRVVLTGNADRFDHPDTRILIYDDTAEQLAIAREVRDLLGTGRIELSEVPQGVVDITILVGEDLADLGG